MWLKLFFVNRWPSSFVADTNYEEWMLVLSFCCPPHTASSLASWISVFFSYFKMLQKKHKFYFSFVMQFLSSDKLLGVPEQMLCKLRRQEELHSQTAFCGNEGKATEAKHTQLRTTREESHIPICISLRGWKEKKKNLIYKAKSDTFFFFALPFHA